MMDSGTSRIVLEKMAGNENNLIILTGYCMAVRSLVACECRIRWRAV